MRVNRFSILAVLMFMALGSVAAQAEIQTVSHVDVNRYLGDWYQIAHIPLIFEGGACSCARQRLTPSATAGVVTVFNSCNKGDASGALTTISGTATDDDSRTNAKFTVSLEGVPIQGSYWIIGLDSDYRYAVVSDSGGDALYILSKTPTLAANLYKEAVQTAAKQVNISSLEVTDQKGCHYPN